MKKITQIGSNAPLVLGFVWCLCVLGCQSHPPALDKTSEDFPLISVDSIIPDAILDLRYAGTNNFIGGVVDGYQANRCLLHPAVVKALAKAASTARQQGLRLHLFDCYRPQRAVNHFVRWSRDLTDDRTKALFYPNLDKSKLLGDYIAERSGHSRGATLDLSLAKQDDNGQWRLLDMGTPFDFFDRKANTDSLLVSQTQRANRQILLLLMQHAGFVNYPMEWWHFTYKPEPTPQQYFNEPVR